MEPDNCVARSQQLPGLLWQKVFLHLEGKSLAQVRLTCRTWKAIVDRCPVFRDRCAIIFPRGLQWNSSYNPEFLHPAASGAVFIDANITYSGFWWGVLGARLTRLAFYSCRFTIYDLVCMLRTTPNLRFLSIHQVEDSSNPEWDEVTIRSGKRFAVNFQLRQLQEFYLRDIPNAGEITRVVERMHPPLKNFHHYSMLPLGEPNTCRFMQDVAGTLETLTATFTDKVMQKLIRMEQLVHLKHLTLLGMHLTTANVIAFVRRQPLIQSLALFLIQMRNEEINTILNAAPKLQALTVQLLSEPDEPTTLAPSFLRQFPNVQKLVLSGCTIAQDPVRSIRLPETVQCLQLTDLTLESVKFDRRFPDFWKNVPNLAKLTLGQCILSEMLTLADIMAQAKLLQKLELKHVQIESKEFCHLFKPCRLLELHLEACEWPEAAIITLVCYCPELEAISLTDMPTVTDTGILVIMQRSNLKALTLANCPLLTARSAVSIKVHGQKLERVHIRNCEPMQEMINFMKERGY